VTVRREKRGWPVSVVGTQATGWKPVDPRTAPVQTSRRVLMDVRIDEDAGGYLLVYAADDGSVYGDTWHATLEEAEQVAEELFELRDSDWDASGSGEAS
jgi:hypothetical protein